MKAVAAIMLLLSVPTSAPAQTAWFEGNSLQRVFLVDANNGTAVGGGLNPAAYRFGIIRKTTDGGSHWDIQTTGESLFGVFFTGLDNGTVVGAHGAILKTTNGGIDWIPQTSGTGNHLWGLSFADDDTGTIVGAHGTILRTANAGETWNLQLSGTTNDLEAVSFVNASIGTAVGHGGTILRTMNGGDSWVPQLSGTNNHLLGVSFTNKDTGTVVGFNGTILRTTNGGDTWVPQQSNTSEWLFGVSFVDANNGTVVGLFGTILRTTNGGNSWVSQQSGTSNYLIGVSFADVNNGTAVGLFGTVLRTTDGGDSWISQATSQVQARRLLHNGVTRDFLVFLPRAYPEQDVLPVMIALCRNGSGASYLDHSRMCSVADTGGFIVVYPSPFGGLWDLTSDVDFISALIDMIGVIYRIDPSRVYVSGFSTGGRLVHEVACRLSHKVTAIAPVGGTIMSSTISNCSSAPPVFYMHGTMDPVIPFGEVPQTLEFWVNQNNSGAFVDSIALPDIDTTDGSTVMKYTFRNSQREARVVFYKVINGGHQWPGSSSAFAGFGNRNMDVNAGVEIWNFVRDFQRITGISDRVTSVPVQYALYQNYPNPFNPNTIISYLLPTRSPVMLKVYDLLGREVATLVDEIKSPGSYEVTWDASGVSSGVYLYRLQAGNFTQTKKLILLK